MRRKRHKQKPMPATAAPAPAREAAAAPLSAPPRAMVEDRADPQRLYRLRAAEVARSQGWFFPEYRLGEDAVTRDAVLSRKMSRDAMQNSPIYRALAEKIVTNVLGEDGGELQMLSDDAEKVASYLAKWNAWCRRPEISGRFAMSDFERIILRELLVAGAVLLVKHPGMVLELVEAEYIHAIHTRERTGEIDSFVLRIPKTGGGFEEKNIGASRAIYLADTTRYTQYSGISTLLVSLPMILQIEYIQGATAQAWGAASAHALAATLEAGIDGMGGSKDPAGARVTYDIDGTKFFVGKPGEKLEPVDQNKIPNANLDKHCFTFLQYICAPHGVNPDHMLSDFSKVTYASDKGAKLNAQMTVKRMQNHLSRMYYQIVWWLFGSLQKAGDLDGGVEELEQLQVILPSMQTSDERQEAGANAEQIAIGTKTLDEILVSHNKDPRAHRAARRRQIIEAIRESQAIHAETGVLVPWQTLCGLPVSVNADPAAETGTPDASAEAPAEVPTESPPPEIPKNENETVAA